MPRQSAVKDLKKNRNSEMQELQDVLDRGIMSSDKRTLGTFISEFLLRLEFIEEIEMFLEKIKKHQKGSSYGNE
ncbi:hypothetical protein [Metabacillus litoralis]|uniref:hypothetical protein n=1 Tax=Metabacillus litoralis TaxID=152268 RepID=UPI0011BEB6DF|nr:hypothetical protein [Metabacillus litoralis]